MEEEYESGVKSLDEEEPPQFIPSWVLYLSGLGAAFITLSFVYRFYKEYQRLKSGKEDDDGDIALRLQNRNNLFGSLLNISIMGRHRRLSDIESDGGRHSFTKMKSRLSDNFTPSPLSSSIVRSIDAVPSQVASRKRAFQPSKIELMSGDTVQSTFTRTPCIRGLKGNIIFTAPMVQKAFAMLPTKYRIRDLRLLYKGSVDGFNIRTFYTRVRHQGPNLLIVQDMKKHVFGAFVPSSWRKSEYYYGTGETFVMKLHPEFKPYTWTSKNSYFVLAKNDFIAIGGGSNFAIWLDQSFRKGSSLPCDTFDSPELSKTGDFTCMDLEVYGFDDPSYVPPA